MPQESPITAQMANNNDCPKVSGSSADGIIESLRAPGPHQDILIAESEQGVFTTCASFFYDIIVF